MQTRLMSLVETMTNILVGLVISFLSQIVIFKVYNVSLSTQQNVEITLYFTIISILRSYALRRFFNSIRRTI
jgi:hypothetical protein